MKAFWIGLIFSLLTLSAYGQTSIVAVKSDDTGDVWISIMDDPGRAPFESTVLWQALAGDESTKKIYTASLSLECKTLMAEPQKQRFGSCVLEVKGIKVQSLPAGDSEILIDGEEALQILSHFKSSEQTEKPALQEIRLANGELLMTADHPKAEFRMLVKSKLFPKD